jgi:DNA-binding CsgD family transcriptional regulator
VTVVVGVDGAGRTHRLRQLAAGAPAWWVGHGDLQAGLATARDDGLVVVADDAHRLTSDALRALAAAARDGLRVIVARRPTITSAELADLDEVAAADGVELLDPLTRDEVGTLVAGVTGRPVSPEVVAEVHERSAGLPGVAVVLARSAAPALLARVQRRFAVLPQQVGAVARVLALRLDLPDDVLATAAEMPPGELPGVLRTLRDEGMLAGERLVPAIADAVLGELSAAERRRVHDTTATALAAAGADPLVTAAQLRAARVRTPAAADVYRAAGERLRFTDPAAALAWFDDAADAGAEPSAVAAGRAEAGALLGMLDADLTGDDPRTTRLAGAVAAYDGRTDRAADLLRTAAPALAVPVLVATGRLAEAQACVLDGRPATTRFAEAVLTAARDPDAAVPLLIEAAELAERAEPVAVLPDTPHAVGAVVAVLAGDVAAAEYLLERALHNGFGGPVAADRHRLLLAWARMRAGRYDTALAELSRTAHDRPARERLLHAAIAAGMARRRGDIAALRAVWGGVEPVLARRAVDLWQLEPAEELLVAAARLRQVRRVEPILAVLDRTVAPLGPAWAAALGWLRVQVAVAADEPVTRQPLPAAGHRAAAQAAAAGIWAQLAESKPEHVLEVTEQLVAAQLPWEASRLAGQAAIHGTDPIVVRRLLERARELSEPDAPSGSAAQTGGLSERELAVAKLVLAGSTHREIGGQLFIAPKTVEHHVARIRAKLGAGSRAELIATLREVLADLNDPVPTHTTPSHRSTP